MKEKIAIIGSGISGLTAAYILSNKYEVHLFEKNKRLGGHTRTVLINELSKKIPIDTGFIVFNENNYPDLTNFFKLLNVEYSDSNMSFAVSNQVSNVEYSGKNLMTLFSNFKNLFSLNFLKMIFEIKRFYKICENLETSNIDNQKTLEEFLHSNKFSNYLINYHIMPMISSIWSSDIKDVKKFPLITFIEFFKNHSLFKIKKRPKWKFVKGGSNEYIKKIISKKLFYYNTNFSISKIIRDKDSIKILSNNKNILRFDKIVLAVHANQVLSLLDNPTEKETKIFSKFKYSMNSAYLHCDSSLMPRSRYAWSSWNFLNSSSSKKFTLTYWMNLLQKLPTSKNYFVTINPYKIPKDVIDKKNFAHPIYSSETLSAQKEVMQVQGLNNTYFCGAYLGYGFHEDGIQSSAYIANLLNCDLPWKRAKNFYNRLKVNVE